MIDLTCRRRRRRSNGVKVGIQREGKKEGKREGKGKLTYDYRINIEKIK